jgi:hypothetical protein
MSTKKRKELDLDEDLNEELTEDDDSNDEIVDEIVEETTESEESIDILDDEEVGDIVIEIDEEDLKFDPKEEEPEDVVLSKHTIQGKHSLKYDSIFKGRKENPLTEDDVEINSNFNDNFEVDKSSMYWHESIDNENYIKEKRLKEKVYEVLLEHTDINFLNNRRKPSRVDFNHYYFLLRTNLQGESFTNVELFNELAVYFSDNLFNMFKLLDNKWRNLIITELQDHIGKQHYSHEVIGRNIHVGTEIEFMWEDTTTWAGELQITGVVIEAEYEISLYKVNSYEKIYEVKIDQITKILNNTKFKYNLNKLNHIDFL